MTFQKLSQVFSFSLLFSLLFSLMFGAATSQAQTQESTSESSASATNEKKVDTTTEPNQPKKETADVPTTSTESKYSAEKYPKKNKFEHRPDVLIDGDDADNSKIWTTHFNLSAYSETETLDKGGASWSGSSYFSFNYKIDGDERFAIRPVIYFNTPGFNKYGDNLSSDASLGDLYFVYTHYDIIETSSDSYSLSFSQRAYLPTSENSKATKMMARSGSSLLHKFQLAKYTYLTLSHGFDYYFQSQKASLDPKVQTYPDGVTKWDPRRGNQQMALSTTLEFVHSFSRRWEMSSRASLYDSWYYGSDELARTTGLALESRHSTELAASIGGKYKMRRDTDFRASVSNSSYLGTGYAFGRPSDNEVSIGTNIRF